MNPIFGPYYPPLLQLAMSHAERLVALLTDFEGHRLTMESDARIWLTGRAQEVETIVGCIAEDWREGRLTEEAAEEAASAYVRAVHVGARRHLGLGEIPPCCLGDVEQTRAPRDVTMPMSAALPPSRAGGDTIAVPVAQSPSAGDTVALGPAPSPSGGDTIAVAEAPFFPGPAGGGIGGR